MAGDWIKVQHTTPDKPEVVAMATALGIDQDAVVGKLLRLWIWADQQTIDGNALSVTPAFLDRLTFCPGFSVAACSVGWLVDRQGRLQLPHFDRHNGQTAKSRALTSDRVTRSRKCNAPTVTESLPEKRREEGIQEVAPTREPPVRPPPEFDPWLEAFLALWNATPGTVRATSVSELQRRKLDARRADAWFERHYRAALERFPLPFYAREGNHVGLSKFLEDGFAEGVVEGKYHNDWGAKHDSRSSTNTRRRSRATEQEAANVDALVAFAEGALQHD